MLDRSTSGGTGGKQGETALGGTPKQRAARNPLANPPSSEKLESVEVHNRLVTFTVRSTAGNRSVELAPEKAEHDPEGVSEDYRLEHESMLQDFLEEFLTCNVCAEEDHARMLADYRTLRIGTPNARMATPAFFRMYRPKPSPMFHVDEERQGLASKYSLECARGHTLRWTCTVVGPPPPLDGTASLKVVDSLMCRRRSLRQTRGIHRRDVNVRASGAGMNLGIGGRGIERLAAFLDIPVPAGFVSHTFSSNERFLGDVYEELSQGLLAYWNEEEKRMVLVEWESKGAILEDKPEIKLTIGAGTEEERTITCVLVAWSVDGAWTKRSTGTSYSSHSGVQWAFGRLTGHLLDFNVFCLQCAKCEAAKRRAEAEEKEPTYPLHEHEELCVANFTKDGGRLGKDGGQAYRASQAGTMEPVRLARDLKSNIMKQHSQQQLTVSTLVYIYASPPRAPQLPQHSPCS